jgi:hypothetical protein
MRATDLTRDWAAARVRVRPALPSFVGLQFVERAEALAAQPDAIDRIGAVPNAFNEVSIERTSRIHVTRLQSGSEFRFQSGSVPVSDCQIWGSRREDLGARARVGVIT